MKKNKTFQDLLKHMDEHIPESKDFVNRLSCILGREIHSRRVTLGLTQADLANRAKDVTGKPMHQSTVSEAEGGTAILTTETYDRLLKALDVTDIKLTFKNEYNSKRVFSTSYPSIRSTLKRDNISL